MTERSDPGRGAPAGRPDDAPADTELDRQRAALRELVTNRRAEQRQAERLEPVLRAIAQARRDRDAASSTRLARHRALFEQMMRDVEETAVGLARIGVRLMTLHAPDESPLAREARAAGQQALDALHAVTAASGSDS